MSEFDFLEVILSIRCGFYRSAVKLVEQTADDGQSGIHPLLNMLKGTASFLLSDFPAAEKCFQTLLAIVNAALFYYLSRQYQEAFEYCDRACRTDPEYTDEKAWSLFACINAATGNVEEVTKICENLAETTSVFGDLSLLEVTLPTLKDTASGLVLVDALIEKYPESNLLRIEKAKVLLAAKETQTASRILESLTSSNTIRATVVGAHLAKTFSSVLASCVAANSIQDLLELFQTFDEEEPGNLELHVGAVDLFSTIASSEEVLKFLEECLEDCLRDCPDFSRSGLLLQKAILSITRGDAEACRRTLEECGDNAPMEAVLCSAHASLLQGRKDEALSELSYVEEHFQGSDPTPYFLHLKGALLANQNRSAEVASLVDQALDVHLASLPSRVKLFEFYQALEPHRVCDMLDVYLQVSPKDPIRRGDSCPAMLKRACEAARLLSEVLPVNPRIQLLHSQLLYLSGAFASAISTARNITENIDSQCTDAYLLETKAHLVSGDHVMAKRSLENCLSYNFSMRSKPEYHFLLGCVQKQQGELTAALKSFEHARSLIQENGTNDGSHDVVALVCETCLALADSGRQDEAIAQLEEAISNSKDVEQSNFLIFTWVEVMLSVGNADSAVDALQRILPSSRYFTKSRKYLADVALKKFNDKAMYISCFREIIEVSPSSDNFIILGNAYMDIHIPEKAIEAYEEAKARGDNSVELVKIMGDVYLKSHQFSKALSYFRGAMESSDDPSLLISVGEIHFRIGQYDKAAKTLKEAGSLLDGMSSKNYETLRLLAQAKFKEAKVHMKNSADPELVVKVLQQAYEIQSRVVRQGAAENPDHLVDDRNSLGEICLSLGRRFGATKQYESATRYYKEALSLTPNCVESLKALASIFVETGDEDQCQSMYASLSKVDSSAGVFLGQLELKKGNFTAAVQHARDVLDHNSKDEEALLLLFKSCRLAGMLRVAEKYLNHVEQDISHQSQAYLKALFKRFVGQFRESIGLLLNCKNDPKWESLAAKMILENILDSSVFVGMEPRPADEETRIMYAHALKSVKCSPEESHVYGTYLKLLTGQKPDADIAIHSMSLLNRETPSNLLAQAVGYLITKQVPKAKAHLKRFAHNPWTLADAEWLEKCWLLLAELYINTNKADQAREHIQRALQYNALSLRSQELLGMLAEREHAFSEAARFYELVWKGSRKSNLAIGYRCGSCLLKAKRYTETIDLCQTLLGIQTDFPRLHKDVYEKALAQIRT